ncbi:MAG: HD domain-containing protein [Chitinispirillaceae bacterium]
MNEILKHIESWFDEYTSSFSSPDVSTEGALRLKEEHCRRVMNEIRSIGRSVHLDDTRMEMASIAGLLHDIGRFEQFMKYRTFLDRKSINHAALSASIVQREQILSSMDESSKNGILNAIDLHNKALVPEDKDDSLWLARMLRDADKLDIWNVVSIHFQNPLQSTKKAVELDLPDSDSYSPQIIDSILCGNPWQIKNLCCVNDFKLILMGWIFDINFPHTFREIKERRILENLKELLPNHKDIERVFERCFSHLEANV